MIIAGGYIMEKNPNKHYLDKDYILTMVAYRYRTVSAFLKEYGTSRSRFYEILNTGYVSKNRPAVEKLRKLLGVREGYLWEK